ncbi:hypothetical protein [Cytobacillus purgationiresistens]|uniref:Uncharacterized protein n=1 Tax=Cytobacillus purgationiresistens TaxID=863449 RepID=A0ABU0AHL5_9BACI|nr:hypothetical protein [Cytobacillus purgationiresistens]MDQ0270747.1 hypothetical protein [Cytobacillus purgationiresistens]
MNNEQFNDKINELWAQTKAGNLPRPSRFEAIEALTEEYFAARGKMPEAGALDRLATLCLYEELSDDTPWKSRSNEYPINSDRQQEEIEKNEVGMQALGYVNNDGKKPQSAGRRKRTDYENTKANRSRSRNAERRRRYREFTKVQPVVISHLIP